jgi:hypothetical protein
MSDFRLKGWIIQDLVQLAAAYGLSATLIHSLTGLSLMLQDAEEGGTLLGLLGPYISPLSFIKELITIRLHLRP